MAVLKFKMKEIVALLDELENAERFSPSFVELFNPTLHRDRTLLDKDGLTQAEADKKGLPFTPSADNIEDGMIHPTLLLVGDHGVYLITNADLPGSPCKRGTIAYAQGCNPDTDENFSENKSAWFGCEDDSIPIPIPMEWIFMTLQAGKPELEIEFYGATMRLVLN